MQNDNFGLVIYNLASIDSVIAAAMLMRPGMRASPASNKITPPDVPVTWVGVMPTMETYKAIFSKISNVAFLSEETDPRLSKVITVFTSKGQDPYAGFDGIEGSDLPHMAESVFKAVTLYSGRNNLFFPNLFIQRFMSGDEKMTLEEQTWVWRQYHNALNVLNRHANGGDDEFNIELTVTEEDTKAYLAHMKEIKRQITRLYEATSFKIDGKHHRVPLVNINQDLAPWVLRILSNTYDFAVTYEQQRTLNVYTTFSRFAGFDECIIRQISDGKNATFSHWL